MCGIVGIINFNAEPVSTSLLKSMTDTIAHRGPDGEGFYVDGPVGLGHRRLAVIDPTPAGQQPMSSNDGSLFITYSGEVYNFLNLRSILQAKGYQFHSKTDTEVVLHLYQDCREAAVPQLNGMFAFAIWDSVKRELFLARDRYGIKPLYYYQSDKYFIFASEIKAILKHSAISAQICYKALSDYFTFQNIFDDNTLFEGIHLLPAGTILKINAEGGCKRSKYWDFNFNAQCFEYTEEECKEELLRIFREAVTTQLVSDVPVGSYLSGGMDSGSVTAIASQKLGRLHTFTGGFDLSSASGLELGFDERPASEVMANEFKTEHYEIVMHAGDMENVLPDLIWHLEDLRMGQSYPNYYVARLASKFVKVVLSGMGGDELFGGYPWRYYRNMNSLNDEGYFKQYYNYWQRLVLDEDRSDFYNPDSWSQIKHHHPYDEFALVFNDWQQPLEWDEDFINASLYFEAKTFLHGLFVVEDKLSMAHSLETRVPFLDNNLVDFASRIPPRYKLRNLRQMIYVDENEQGKLKRYRARKSNDGKVILRQAMNGIIPQIVSKRAKQGFSAPDASWFRGESIEYVRKLLQSNRTIIYNYLNPRYIQTRLDEHMSGAVNHRLFIWSLISFEWWCRKFLS